jgi:copper resistance protein B
MGPAFPRIALAGVLAVAGASSVQAQATADPHAGHGASGPTAPAPAAGVNPSPVQSAGATPASAAVAGGEDHAGHSPLYFGAVLFDQNELRSRGRGNAFYAWEGIAYYGTDYHRLWINSRGETNSQGGGLERAEVQALYSRLLGYYWDIQAGVRHDFQIDRQAGTPPRTYGVLSLQGLAPGFFEVQLQGFVSQKGIFLARAAASYDLLITNRVVLQPEFELNFSTGWDREALIAPGLYRMEAGIRLRYEITREFAPYIGYSFESFNGGATGLNRRLGERSSQSTIVAGVRLFF